MNPLNMRRFLTYFSERFNPIQTGLMTLFYGGAIMVSVPVAAGITDVSYNGLVLVVFFLFLLRLRLVDDVKDFAHDVLHHESRAAARGVVSRRELIYSSVLVLSCEFLIAYSLGTEAFILFAAGVVYSALLLYEAIVIDVMRQYFTFYIFLHELMLIPALLYFFLVSGISISSVSSTPVILLLIFFVLSLFQIELVRKVRSSQNESDGHDTYSSEYGQKTAVVINILVGTLTLAVLYFFTVAVSLGGVYLSMMTAVGTLVYFAYKGRKLLSEDSLVAEKSFFTAGGVYTATLLTLIILSCLF